MSLLPKRLIEVDLPIARISASARAEKDSRQGHIPQLHIYPAARPLAASRSIALAALLPDPADSLCPEQFRHEAANLLRSLRDHRGGAHRQWNQGEVLRDALLGFIAEFSQQERASDEAYLATARSLVNSAYRALGGGDGDRPLVFDPFSGGGSIPLEALRIGASVFASDLNPVSVLINRVVAEYVPRFGNRLVEAIDEWCSFAQSNAQRELAVFYPGTADGLTPIAYLWARTILSEAPDEGETPVEIPLLRSMWLARKGKKRALRWKRDARGLVQASTVAVRYADGSVRTVRRPLLEVFEPRNDSEVESGTVARSSATCPVTRHTTPAASVRRQLRERRGGTRDARLFCVVFTSQSQTGRIYRVPSEADQHASEAAAIELERRAHLQAEDPSLVPDEPTPLGGGKGASRAFSQRNYGLDTFSDLFTARQLLALTTYARLAREYVPPGEVQGSPFTVAVNACLALLVDRLADLNASLCVWQLNTPNTAHVFGRWAIGMVMDFGEVNPLAAAGGSPESAVRRMKASLIDLVRAAYDSGTVAQAPAQSLALPDDAADALITDPPYYDAVPYADILDFFYVWMRRSLSPSHPLKLLDPLAPKASECIVDQIKGKDHDYFQNTIRDCFAEARRVVKPSGIAVVVFAHKSTAGWESLLAALIEAGWIITASWPIDTEMGSRLRAKNSAALASSVHLVCRPRENDDGSLRHGDIGEWREVLAALPSRIHEWMPRLAAEGVVGADAIFACLGPALEIFSRYSRVEKSNGDRVALAEYLEHVWAAVANEALSTIFQGADSAGLAGC